MIQSELCRTALDIATDNPLENIDTTHSHRDESPAFIHLWTQVQHDEAHEIQPLLVLCNPRLTQCPCTPKSRIQCFLLDEAVARHSIESGSFATTKEMF